MKTPQPQLSLCMIVRDSARTLPACLESIRPWVDEMIVVDTGSQDDTRDIARRFGARVFEFPWCDDFSAARNESIRFATGEWLFWMDSDDTIEADQGRKLRALVHGPHPENILGFVMQVICPGSGESGGHEATVVDHVKLFRNRPKLRFEFRIHEQLLPAVRRLGGDVGWTDLAVVHSGSDHSAEGKQRKYERDLRILSLELVDRPEHPFTLFNLGMTYSDMGDHARAADYLERSLRASAPQESHVRKVHALLVHSHDQSADRERAEEACRRGLADYPDDPELLFRQGKLAHQAGRLDEARSVLRRLLGKLGPRHFTSIDRGILGYKARFNLALVLRDMQRPDLAEIQWRKALDEEPTFAPALRLLGETLVARQKTEAAKVLLEASSGREGLELVRHLIAADLAVAQRDVGQARAELVAAVDHFPASVEALDFLCRLEFEERNDVAACSHLERLVVLAPHDPSAHHNLGAVLLRLGQLPAAKRELQQSLELRPRSHATQQLLDLTSQMLLAQGT